ncbi:MAG TPA: hypothetical protein VF631_03030 [Allosphingosinicella sp.]|jgi:hypothetical protein|uniref:hypothetical protein n=1 Tax=Allosphingosinicella sp. TaxID=2823234 RepID=UPI002F2A5E0C
MAKLLIALLLMLGLESRARACSCVPPGPPEQSRQAAREIVQGAVAIVDVQALSDFHFASGRGERVRVLRTRWGRAPKQFEIQRRTSASSASCDLLLAKGQRKTLILYPAGMGRYRIQSLCSDYLVGPPAHLAVTLQEARRRS